MPESALPSQGDDGRFGATRDPIGELNNPDAARGIYPGPILAKESGPKATVPDVAERRSDEGQANLAAVGMAAEDKVKEGETRAQGEVCGVVGVVGQKEGGAGPIPLKGGDDRHSGEVIIGTNQEERA